MKAIEIKSKTDKKGNLKINYQLNKSNRNVRILILLEDDPYHADDEEKLWMDAVSDNPAFDYLFEESEDVYSVNDGEPFND
jgi:hypothetical protein